MIQFEPVHVLFSIAGIEIYVWGLMFVVAFLLSFLLAWRASRNKLEEKHFFNIVILILVGAIVGARLLYVFINFSYYLEKPLRILAFSEGGSSSFGGFLALLFVWLYVKKHKLNFGAILDFFAPYVVLALAIGRIGCFLNWCCYGIPTTAPWAVQVQGVARHPTQLYLLLTNLVVFFIILRLQKKKEWGSKGILNFDGALFLFFLLYYSIARFLIDFLREYEISELFLGLAISQWFSLAFIVFSITLLLIIRGKLKS
ncbi:MAG: prolipoprotein diacylglyceryl transferase [Candidatus Pacearchaeota archaeon]